MVKALFVSAAEVAARKIHSVLQVHTRLLAVHKSTPEGSQAHDTVIEFSALSDCIANTTHIETLWQLPSAHSEEPEPFDLKHLIKAFAGLCLCKGKKPRNYWTFLLYNSFK